MANLSHDIRTPLSGIIGLSDVLLQENPGGEQGDFLREINHASFEVMHIANEVLDLIAVETGVI